MLIYKYDPYDPENSYEPDPGTSDIDVRIFIDGMPMGPEEGTEEIVRSQNTIEIRMLLGIKRMIQRHPEEYVDDLHWPLFTEQERQNLLIRGAA